jgi:7,8-dihydropterin-6-yl-methyl-4-(beta-D-ribofuranosyl)aminobenzene 5'-phosphate synthase
MASEASSGLSGGTRVDIEITSVYNDNALPDRGFKSGHGQSFYIVVGEEHVLFDVGWKGGILTQNLARLGISVDEIDKLVLSHGHRDHTGALPRLLKVRTVSTPIVLFSHPDAWEAKSVKRLRLLRRPFGIPKLKSDLARKISLRSSREPVQIAERISTTGEILNRPELEAMEKRGLHKSNGRWVWDRVIDELSLILQTKDGLVIVTGCCHAGVLNTCAKAAELFHDKIKAIVGGTHMENFSDSEISRAGELLQARYGTPELYLNHCTSERAIHQLRDELGSDKVHDCHVGTVLSFRC